MNQKEANIALDILNRVEPNGELLTTELALEAMEEYSLQQNKELSDRCKELEEENLKIREAVCHAMSIGAGSIHLAEIAGIEYSDAPDFKWQLIERK